MSPRRVAKIATLREELLRAAVRYATASSISHPAAARKLLEAAYAFGIHAAVGFNRSKDAALVHAVTSFAYAAYEQPTSFLQELAQVLKQGDLQKYIRLSTRSDRRRPRRKHEHTRP